MLSTHFDMKDLGEASYVLGIKILRDRANEVLKLSQRTYIEKILKRFNMHNCSSTRAPVVKGDKFSKTWCPQNDDEKEEMRTIPYSSLVGSLMYAQVCTRPNIAFIVRMLGRYLSNPESQHWKTAKKVLSGNDTICVSLFVALSDEAMSLNLCERQNPSTISVLIIIKRHRLIYTANDVVFCLRAKPRSSELNLSVDPTFLSASRPKRNHRRWDHWQPISQHHSSSFPWAFAVFSAPPLSTSKTLLNTDVFLFLTFSGHPIYRFAFIQRSLVILLFWILAVLIVLRENFDHILIHESLVFVFAAISFVAEYSVIGKGINGLGEAVYEWLGGLTLLCAASCLYLSIRPTAFFAEFLLCSGIVFKGTWLLQAGLSLYSDVFSLKGCHKFLTDVVCDLEEDSLRGVALMNLLFIGHAIGVLITCLVLFGTLSSNQNLRHDDGTGSLLSEPDLLHEFDVE
ncbi:hypothetical protein VitviT2T_006786 [Vitis vinifera]|uniref:Reverse transcriptase Ty1/copia-type domain-containing protein n=1 Tax=Vitis vinifera TaxID=29760 RepID=A0ABY9BX38_VITVI|nr:hypothetical protein VitviT2T_006786 [Vitis vinifera]